jgi:2-dehydro-3-deoxyphosphogluconate aldolase / (4S)-4-hydroxy-2-oxoglutarate aldolase
MTQEIKQRLESAGLISVLRARSAQEAYALVEAMHAGGVTVIEVTMTIPNAIEVLKELRKTFGPQLLLGSGTVTSATECEETIHAGADFVVSPSLHPEVIQKTLKLGRVSIPGGLTPTEIITAWRAGGDYVKVFPCSAMGGASYLRSIKAPFPEIPLIPTGGVTLGTAADFIRAGASVLGVGADLANSLAIAEGRPESITQTAREYLARIDAGRKREN